MEGVDFAFSNPNPAGLYAAGKRFAMRYVGPGTSPKHLTVAEADALKRAGLSLVTLVEGATGDPKGGFSVGVSHARQAVEMLKARGFPTNRPMYFAIDYDVSSSAWPAAREYLRGAASVIGAGLVGIYGEHDAMVWAARDGVAAWFFQTYAWSGGRWFAGNHVEQYHNGVSLAGGTVDLCRNKKVDFGQWGQSQINGGGDVAESEYDRNTAWRVQDGVLGLQDPVVVPQTDLTGSPPKYSSPNLLKQKLDEILTAARAGAAGGVTQDQVDAAVKSALLDPEVLAALAGVIGGVKLTGTLVPAAD